MKQKTNKSKWNKFITATGLLSLSQVASADILTSSSGEIDDMSSLWSTIGQGGATAFKFIAAVLLFGALVWCGGHTLSAFGEAKKTGSYGGFAAWFITTVFVVAIVAVLALTVYNAAGDLSSIGTS